MRDRRAIAAGAALAAAAALPLLLREPYLQHVLVACAINAILAVSLGLVIGSLGELSLSHGAFYGIGAYASALLARNLALPLVVSMPLGTLAALVAGVLIGVPALRLSGHYFAIATLGFQGIVILLITNLVGLTRGPMGLSGIPAAGRLPLLGVSLGGKAAYYELALLVLAAVVILLSNLMRSRFGQAFLAVRDDPLLAASVGIRTRRYRLLAFTISAGCAGAAGALYAHYALFISPDSFNLAESVYVATMVIIGGKATLGGAIVGAVLLTILPEVLRVAGQLQFVLYGLVAMLVVIYMPGGIVGLGLGRARRRGAAAAPGAE